MRIKLFLLAVFISLAMTSCRNEKAVKESEVSISDLSDIQIIYCTPTEFGKCLPLELNNTEDGWLARYVGAPSKELLALKPINEVDKDGNSIVVLKEYLEDGSQNGKYILHESPMYVNTFDGVSYVSPQGKDTIDFLTIIIKEGFAYTSTPDVKEDIRKTMEFQSDEGIYGNTEIRDLNISYLLHSNPDVLHKSVKAKDLKVHNSSDGKLRIYSFVGYTGGNGAGSSYDIGILQYDMGNGEIATLDYFTALLYFELVDFGEANFPFCTINSIRTANIGKNTYYLIEALFNDACPMSLDNNGEYYKTDDTVLYAFTIRNGKLTPARIFGKDWLIEVVGSQKTKALHFGYDDATKIVSVPIVEGNAHLFNGKYKKIKLQ